MDQGDASFNLDQILIFLSIICLPIGFKRLKAGAHDKEPTSQSQALHANLMPRLYYMYNGLAHV